MNKENRQLIYIGFIFVVCYFLLVIIAIRPIYAFDSFWHLQMGKDFMENNLSPWVDHYSFSYYGKDISTVPIVFQVLLYKFISLFGESKGFYLIKLFYVSLMMAVLYSYFRKIKASEFIVFLLLPMMAYFIHVRLMVRPEIFSNVLIIICLILYLRAQKSFVTKELLLICLLLLFWVNYHSPIFGYIIVFGLFVDKAVNKYFHGDDSFSWWRWFLWGVFTLLIGFARPNGEHFVVTMFGLLIDDFSKYTLEYFPSHLFYSKNIVVHVSWVLSIYVAIWSVFKRQYGFVFIAVLLGYFSWSTARLVTAATLVNLCILALYLSQIDLSRHLSNVRLSIKSALFAVAICVAFFTYYVMGKEVLISIEKDEIKSQLLDKRYPVQSTDYLNGFQKGGNILNVMRDGGYLINKLLPDFKIYFDGRTNILYPIEFVEYNKALTHDLNELKKTITQYDIKYILNTNTPETYAFLKMNGRLKLNYADENYLVFADNVKNSFPLSSMLLVFPACWEDGWSQGIRSEIKLAKSLFVNKSYSLVSVLNFLDEYLAYEDKQEYFRLLPLESIDSDGVRRIALQLAFNAGNLTKAVQLFKSIQIKTEYDILIYSYHMAQNKEYEISEYVLYYFYTVTKFVKKKKLLYEKMEIMLHTLKILDKNGELKQFDHSYPGELEGKLRDANYNISNVLSFDHICK